MHPTFIKYFNGNSLSVVLLFHNRKTSVHTEVIILPYQSMEIHTHVHNALGTGTETEVYCQLHFQKSILAMIYVEIIQSRWPKMIHQFRRGRFRMSRFYHLDKNKTASSS